MVASFGNRMRALWLACLLAFAPGGPVGLLLTGHAAGEIAHATATPIHDASDHGISAGALADTAADRHCLYCQTASSLRFGSLEGDTRLAAPVSAAIDWPDTTADALRSRLRQALPARAPPRVA